MRAEYPLARGRASSAASCILLVCPHVRVERDAVTGGNGGGMCVVVGPSAVGGLELKQSYLWRLRHLLAQSTQRRVMETRCTWR